MPINYAALEAHLSLLMGEGAERGAEWLKQELSQEGSGVLYAGNPHRSSAPGEMPALQQGNLRASIGVTQTGPLTYEVGSLQTLNAEGYDEAVQLVSRPPTQGGRDFIAMTVADPEFRKALETP